jgi:hypothetical protein
MQWFKPYLERGFKWGYNSSDETVFLVTDYPYQITAEPLGATGLVRITVGTPEMNQALVKAISGLLFCKSSGLSIKGS